MKPFFILFVLVVVADAQFPVCESRNGVVTYRPATSNDLFNAAGAPIVVATVANPAWTNYWHAYNLSWEYGKGPTDTVYNVTMAMSSNKWNAISNNNVTAAWGVDTDEKFGIVDFSVLKLSPDSTLGTNPPPQSITTGAQP